MAQLKYYTGAAWTSVAPSVAQFNGHMNNYDDPHQYLDEASSEPFVGVRYKLVVDEGQLFLEVTHLP